MTRHIAVDLDGDMVRVRRSYGRAANPLMRICRHPQHRMSI